MLCCGQADDLTCELQCIMREGLAVVVETEMRAAYDDLWYVHKTDYFITRRQMCTDMCVGLGILDSVDSVLDQLLASCLFSPGQAFKVFFSKIPYVLINLLFCFCRDKIVFIKPPWTLTDLLQLLDK